MKLIHKYENSNISCHKKSFTNDINDGVAAVKNLYMNLQGKEVKLQQYDTRNKRHPISSTNQTRESLLKENILINKS
jgi:hypothetical protein